MLAQMTRETLYTLSTFFFHSMTASSTEPSWRESKVTICSTHCLHLHYAHIAVDQIMDGSEIAIDGMPFSTTFMEGALVTGALTIIVIW